jgi:hypothetical protein
MHRSFVPVCILKNGEAGVPLGPVGRGNIAKHDICKLHHQPRQKEIGSTDVKELAAFEFIKSRTKERFLVDRCYPQE